MTETKPNTCAYPGCEVVITQKFSIVGHDARAEEAPSRGPLPRYCELPEHNTQTVFQALQRGEGEASPDTVARLGLEEESHRD